MAITNENLISGFVDQSQTQSKEVPSELAKITAPQMSTEPNMSMATGQAELVTPAANEAFTPDELTDVPDPIIPELTTPEETQAMLDDAQNASADSTVGNIDSILAKTETETERESLTGRLEGLMDETTGREKRLLEEENKLGLADKEQTLRDLNEQIKQTQTQSLLAQEQATSGTGLRRFSTGRASSIARQANLELAGLQIQATAAAGNINAAQAMAQRAVDAEFAPAEQEIANIATLLELNYQNLTREDKKKADELSISLQAQQAAIDNKKSIKESVFNIALKAQEKGADQARVQAIMASESEAEALYNAGESLATLASDDLLSRTDAAAMGLPFGTTEREAAAMGIVPGAVLSPTDKVKQEFSMSKTIDSSTKTARDAARQAGIMEAGYNAAVQAGFDGTSKNAPTQTVLVTFQKMLDPTSVVRESEYARSGAGQSLLGRIKGTVDTLRFGGAGVTEAELQSFYEISQDLLEGYNAEQVDTLSRTRRQADTWGLSLDNIITPDAQRLLDADDKKRFENYYIDNPEDQAVIDQIIQENPDISEYDILRAFGSGFNQDLGTSLKGLKKEGSYGGQCTTFLHGLAEFPSIGDFKNEKFASVDKFGIKKENWFPKNGDIIVTDESKKYGHTAMVTDILPNGDLVLTESNYKEPNKVSHNRKINYYSPSIYGAIRPKKLKV